MVTMGVREQMVNPATVKFAYFVFPPRPWSSPGNQFRICNACINGGKTGMDGFWNNFDAQTPGEYLRSGDFHTAILDGKILIIVRRRMMNATFRNLSSLAIAFSMSMAVAPAHSQQPGKSKGKGKQDAGAKGKNGREAGELPFGLEQFSEKRGNLPSGLQKKKDQDGSLPRGLERGGKHRTSSSKAKKGSK
jgi:hypothetical protein